QKRNRIGSLRGYSGKNYVRDHQSSRSKEHSHCARAADYAVRQSGKQLFNAFFIFHKNLCISLFYKRKSGVARKRYAEEVITRVIVVIAVAHIGALDYYRIVARFKLNFADAGIALIVPLARFVIKRHPKRFANGYGIFVYGKFIAVVYRILYLLRAGL